MKKTTLIALTALAAIAMLVPAGSAMAQSSASANAQATATIIAPIGLTRTADLQFGEIVASGTAGTVVISPAGNKTPGGGVTLLGGLPHSAAAFAVTGGADRTFTIGLPSAAVTLTSGSNSMTVGTFTSSVTSPASLNGTGTASFTVGGTLNVGVSQAAGEYTGTFSVTVAYN